MLDVAKEYLSLDAYFMAILFCTTIPTLCTIHFTSKWDYVNTLIGILILFLLTLSWFVEIPLISYITYVYFDEISIAFILGMMILFMTENVKLNNSGLQRVIRISVFMTTLTIVMIW